MASKPATLNQMTAFFFSAAGRASRREFALGMGFLFALAIAVYTLALGRILPPLIDTLPPDALEDPDVVFEMLYRATAQLWFINLPFLFFTIVISARRVHDIGLPGLFAALVLILGVFWLAALALIPGSSGANRYGPPPRYT